MVTVVVIAAAFALVILSNREARQRLRGDERGEVTEKVIITALFAALALTAATIITIKVTERAESIPTEVPAPQGGGLGG
jgi:heme/copper-type cytochrome/quinol oxidase subunit 2